LTWCSLTSFYFKNFALKNILILVSQRLFTPVPLIRLLYFLAASCLLFSCSTKKNTVATRAYHNLTARYNGYYYSNESIDEGVYKIEKSHKDNFDKILPVYVYPSPEKAKATFPDFDKAIKKSSLLIQRHAIKDKKGNEIPTAGKWIDNNWINIGVSHFYKREFFSAIEAFEYVIRTYTKSDDKYTAMIWLIKANNEIGSVTSSEPLISFLKNERHLPLKIRNELPVVAADYYMRRGQNTEAVAKLMEATRNTNYFYGIKKKDRARYSFIIAQLSEQSKDNKRAAQYYKKTIRLKPHYEMVFYSKIKIAKLQDVNKNAISKTKKDLLKMTHEFKNTDYYDVIYYTLGEIEEKQKNLDQAVYYYKKSVQTSLTNQNQKALSYLKLGEINFDQTHYQPAEAYYDSAVVTLPKDHPDYNTILARKKTLETLVGHIKTISREDSLQRIAAMSEKDRNAFIDKLIKYLEKEEERKKAEAEAAKTNTNIVMPGSEPPMPGMPGSAATFYFYNPNTVALGVTEFVRRWGNRKAEDNWRRSNKAITMEDPDNEVADTSKGGGNAKKSTKTREYYLKDLPLNDTLLRKSNSKIIRSYYMMGNIYKEELNNIPKTIATFEELNKRFPDNRYALKSYYMLYRSYLADKNQPKADYYKNKILEEYPDSEFALLIKNPAYAQELSTQKSEAEEFYNLTYAAYSSSNYSESYSKSSEGLKKFGKNDYQPKFEFIKAMSIGKLKGIDSLENQLKLLVAKYPESEVTPLSNDILASIKKQKTPPSAEPAPVKAKVDTFLLNLNAEHFIIAITPDDSKLVEAFKSNISNFNSIFYSEKKFTITSNIFEREKQMVIIKSFSNAKEVMIYYENVMADQDIFKGDVKKELIEILPMFSENLPIFYKNKDVAAYRLFFEENYKKMKQ
jgi:tetratricopeptide (TPR) repeat protein